MKIEYKIYYTLSKHSDNMYHVWKEVESSRGCCFRTVFSSTSINECRKYCRDNNIKVVKKI